MDENDLNACMEKEKVWRCPIQSCRKTLTRKQTLHSHLLSIHGVIAGNPRKKYKLYEQDTLVPVPYTTNLNRKKETGKEHEIEHVVNTPVVIPDDVIYYDNNMEETEMEETTIVFEEEHEVLVDSSSEDECELLSAGTSSENNPPIYVLPPSSEVFQSSLTKSEHTLSVSAFATRHNLSDAAVSDLLRLVQLHLPQNNIAETNITELKEKCGFDKNYLTCKIYCDICKKVYLDDVNECQTPGCDGRKTNTKSCKYFVTSDLKCQIKEILERKGMWDSIKLSKANQDSDSISDITSGQGYRNLQKEGQFLNKTANITLSMFTDGIPLFKSSGVSLWPVYFLINEIPAQERFLRKNMLLWGLWQGHGKPKMNMFLHPLILDLIELYNNGVSVDISTETLSVKAMLVVLTMDLQARAYVTNMTQHNGENGCLFCEEPGTVVASGSGTCRSYTVRDVSAKLRTEAEFQADAAQAHASGVKVKGIFGKSVLSYLPYLSLTDSVVIDYMHGTLLGVAKKMLHLWFDSEYKSQSFYIGNKMSAIDKLLKSIQPPYRIHRMPRIISNTFVHWKASELRNWLLFYSLPCLKDHLPVLYFQHFSCLVKATYILLGQGITSEDLVEAERLYKFFVAQAVNLYGENMLSLNMHNLTHTVHCVKKWGPLWAWSCFAYESFNGEIKQGVHGTGNVCRQIFWAFQAQKRIIQTMHNSDLIKEGNFKDFMEDMLDSSNKKIGQDAYQCKVVKPTAVCNKFQELVRVQLKQLIRFDDEFDFYNVPKIVRNGCLMFCSTCIKTKKQNSYTIALENNRPTGEVGIEVERYLLHKETRRVFAVGKLISSRGHIIEGRVSHLQRLDICNEISVLPAQDLREPFFVIQKNDEVYGALFPNHFERD